MRKAQLNAISRSYTQRGQRIALEHLEDMGINYTEYCKKFGYKGSPVRLLTSINSSKKQTLENVRIYKGGK